MKNLKHLLLLVCCCTTVYGYAKQTATIDTNEAEACSGSCGCMGSSQTPLGIMTDHVHGKGQWMASYTYMNMMMNGNRAGTKRESTDVINRDYFMAPDKMTMQMHMAMVMYGVSDRLTLMGMAGYASNNMSMTMDPLTLPMNMPGMQMTGSDKMTSKSSGFADTKIYALYSLFNNTSSRVITTIGVNLPSGSITRSGPTMTGVDNRLPYAMQIGTGTFGLLPSVTYVSAKGHFSYGGEAGADLNLGMNKQGYKPGNIYDVTAWGSYQMFPFMSVSLRAEGVATEKIKGYDKRIEVLKFNDPSADGHNSGGNRANAYAGLNFSIKKLRGLHLLLEYGMPVYENLNGLQMSSQANILVGAQYTF